MKKSNYSVLTFSLLLPLAGLSAFGQTDFYLGGSNYPAAFKQDSGTLSAFSVYLYPPARFDLQGGRVMASRMIIGQGDTGFRQENYEPLFAHSGGEVLIDGDIALGWQYHGSGVYQLSGGRLSSRALRLGANRDAAGTFVQSGGTNETARLLISEEADNPMALPDSYNHSGYFMSDGNLSTSDTTVGAAREGIFQQNGGTHRVTGMLSIGGGPMRSSYYLGGGELNVQDFWLAGDFTQEGGFFHVEGTVTLAGGKLALTGGDRELGGLMISSNSSLIFGTSASVQHFENSRQLPWANGANLMVRNWNGSVNGGGMHQLMFGTGPSGLSHEQLAQVMFMNPGGLPAGNYPARMLPSGEVVPAALLMTGRSGVEFYLPMRIHTGPRR